MEAGEGQASGREAGSLGQSQNQNGNKCPKHQRCRNDPENACVDWRFGSVWMANHL